MWQGQRLTGFWVASHSAMARSMVGLYTDVLLFSVHVFLVLLLLSIVTLNLDNYLTDTG